MSSPVTLEKIHYDDDDDDDRRHPHPRQQQQRLVPRGSWFFKASMVFLVAGLILVIVFVVQKTRPSTHRGGAQSSLSGTTPTTTTVPTTAPQQKQQQPQPQPSLPATSNATKPSWTSVNTTLPAATNSSDDSSWNNTYTVGSVNGIGYFHCAADTRKTKVTDIVLLHGASSNKEIWETTGVMSLLCAYPQLSTTALDLPVSDGYIDLQNILNELKNLSMVTLPLTLVTPSASSYTVVDWMKHVSQDGSDDAPRYLQTWIPVAPAALPQASDDEIVALLQPVNQTAIPVLAIYGDKDPGGAVKSRRLEALVNATVVEIPGGHVCYRQSPGLFVETIVKYFGLLHA